MEKVDARVYQERSRQRRDKTYFERQSIAFSEGKRVEYLACPLCGLNRPLIRWGNQVKFQFKKTYAILQVRYGGGRGIGFFLNEGESLRLSELAKKRPDIFENLKEEVNKIAEEINKIESKLSEKTKPRKTGKKQK